MKTYSPNEEVDVCVVGSGAGGGVLAKELSEAGFKVVVLEVGDFVKRDDIPTSLPDWELHYGKFHPQNYKRDRTSLDESSNKIRISRFKGVGGSTMHYEGFCTRMEPDDFIRYKQYKFGADWPIKHQQLIPHYNKVEKTLGLSGSLDNPFTHRKNPYPNPAVEFSCAVQKIKAGAHKLGLHVAHAPLAIITRSAPGRAPCNFCGGCWFGCAMGAISNMGQTYIPLALKAACEIRTNSMACRIVLKKNGKEVKGVEYYDQYKNLHLQKCKILAIAGNAIETARLLLLSAINDHPNGIANSSGLVGKNFMGHTLVTGRALLETRVNAWGGPNINGMVQDFYHANPEKYGYVGGYSIALRNAELGPVSFYNHWAQPQKFYGKKLMDYMNDNFGHSISISAYGETFPHEDNQVDLDPEIKDTFGLAIPRVRTQLKENDNKMQRHMGKTLKSILEASNAKNIDIKADKMVMGTHLMGTARMGLDPKTSVTNPFGQTHDIKNLYIADGSLFPTATPSSPTLTIQALAGRVAEGIQLQT